MKLPKRGEAYSFLRDEDPVQGICMDVWDDPKHGPYAFKFRIVTDYSFNHRQQVWLVDDASGERYGGIVEEVLKHESTYLVTIGAIVAAK